LICGINNDAANDGAACWPSTAMHIRASAAFLHMRITFVVAQFSDDWKA
jgi:hypothetical protein